MNTERKTLLSPNEEDYDALDMVETKRQQNKSRTDTKKYAQLRRLESTSPAATVR